MCSVLYLLMCTLCVFAFVYTLCAVCVYHYVLLFIYSTDVISVNVPSLNVLCVYINVHIYVFILSVTILLLYIL